MDKLDNATNDLQAHKDEWAALPVRQKIEMLYELRKNTGHCAKEWVDLAVKHKQIPADSPWVGEEWVSGPWASLATINSLIDTLKAVEKDEMPPIPKISTRKNGQVAAKVFPTDIFDSILLNATTAEVWMEPDVTRENFQDYVASFYQQDNPKGKVALILGAGNIHSIPFLDVLNKLYHQGQVVILKMNPVNDYLGPVFERIFARFVEEGYLRFAYGGADVGKYLVEHDGVEEIHITGSIHSFDAIVFGTDEEGARRKRENDPIMTKPITSELGGVGATIVLPGGIWTQADLQYQAENLVTMKFHNSGFNCVATQVLVLPETWDQRDALLDAIRDVMRNLPPRVPYYPGADDRIEAALEPHPDGETINGRVLITGLDPEDENEYCFNEEIFGPVYTVTNLPGATAGEYLKNAVDFANNTLNGTLGISIIGHPSVMKSLGEQLDKAIENLHYGTVGINAWEAGAFLLPACAWGGYPGYPLNDIESGQGFVHNAFMFEKPQKTVVRGSFYPFPRAWLHGDFHLAPHPVWFVTNKTAHITARRITKFAADPGWKHMPGIVMSAIRGGL